MDQLYDHSNKWVCIIFACFSINLTLNESRNEKKKLSKRKLSSWWRNCFTDVNEQEILARKNQLSNFFICFFIKISSRVFFSLPSVCLLNLVRFLCDGMEQKEQLRMRDDEKFSVLHFVAFWIYFFTFSYSKGIDIYVVVFTSSEIHFTRVKASRRDKLFNFTSERDCR